MLSYGILYGAFVIGIHYLDYTFALDIQAEKDEVQPFGRVSFVYKRPYVTSWFINTFKDRSSIESYETIHISIKCKLCNTLPTVYFRRRRFYDDNEMHSFDEDIFVYKWSGAPLILHLESDNSSPITTGKHRSHLCKVFIERCSYESLPEIKMTTTGLPNSNTQSSSLGLCGFLSQSDKTRLTYDDAFIRICCDRNADHYKSLEQSRLIPGENQLFEEGGRRWYKLDHVPSFQLLHWISSYQSIIWLFGFFWIISRKHKIDFLVSNQHQNEALPIEYLKENCLEHKDFHDDRLEQLKNENYKRIMEIDEKILSILRHLDVKMKTKERKRPHSSI